MQLKAVIPEISVYVLPVHKPAAAQASGVHVSRMLVHRRKDLQEMRPALTVMTMTVTELLIIQMKAARSVQPVQLKAVIPEIWVYVLPVHKPAAARGSGAHVSRMLVHRRKDLQEMRPALTVLTMTVMELLIIQMKAARSVQPVQHKAVIPEISVYVLPENGRAAGRESV